MNSRSPSEPRPPRLASALLRLRRLGARREEIEADLLEVFIERTAGRGLPFARRWFWRDVLSLWWHHGAHPTAEKTRWPRFEVHAMWTDITFAMRLLRRERILSGITVASVTIAVALTTALFGVLNGVANPETGIREPEWVFAVKRSKDQGAYRGWNYQELATLQSARSIAIVAVLNQAGALSGTHDENAARLPFAAVSGSYFTELGGRAAMGRLLSRGDDVPGAPPVIVLSYGLWQQLYGGDDSIVGRTLWLGDASVTVAGVVDRGFTGPSGAWLPPAFWIPLAAYGDQSRVDRSTQSERIGDQLRQLAGDRSPAAAARRHEFETALTRLQGPWTGNIDVFGRLADGAGESRAEAELTAAAVAAFRARGDAAGAALINVDLSDLAGDARPGDSATLRRLGLSILGLVLLVACVNVSNVLFAGAIRRRREIGTRLALGASRWRVVRQLLTESVALSCLGGAAGLLLASWLAPFLGWVLDVPAQIDIALDSRAYAFAALATMVAAIGAGLVPAWYGRRGDLLAAVKGTSSSGMVTMPAGRLRAILIGGQTTAAVLLLVGAALLTRALIHVTTVRVGFASEQLLTVRLSLGRDYDAVRRQQFWEMAVERVRQIPGVQAVAAAGYGPMDGATVGLPVESASPEAGTDALGGSLRRFHRNSTTADYFRTIGLPMLRGRSYTDEEVRTSAPVAVISASLARAAWGESDPIGASLDRVWGQSDPAGAPRMGFLSKPAGTRVIGVAGDTVTTFMRPQTSMIYMPIDSTIYGPLIVRAANPATIAIPVQEALRALDPRVQPRVAFVSENLRQQLRQPRAAATLALVLGITALTLAVVGLFGVTTVVVDLRRHEVAVRMALGATGRAVVQLLLRDCLRPVAIGAVAGLVLAPLGMRFLRAALFGVSPYDPWAILGAIVLLATAAGTAALLPARHAGLVNPVTALKTD